MFKIQEENLFQEFLKNALNKSLSQIMSFECLKNICQRKVKMSHFNFALTLANPVSNFNLTSGNESEDVVSYGASAAQKLLAQLDLIHQLNTVYLTIATQAYALHRQDYQPSQLQNLSCEKIFFKIQQQTDNIFPTLKDIPNGTQKSDFRLSQSPGIR